MIRDLTAVGAPGFYRTTTATPTMIRGPGSQVELVTDVVLTPPQADPVHVAAAHRDFRAQPFESHRGVVHDPISRTRLSDSEAAITRSKKQREDAETRKIERPLRVKATTRGKARGRTATAAQLTAAGGVIEPALRAGVLGSPGERGAATGGKDGIASTPARMLRVKEVEKARALRTLVLMKDCRETLAKACDHDSPGSVFWRLPDHFQGVIEEPMDFGTVKEKLDRKQYNGAADFCHDMRLVFENCALHFDTRDPRALGMRKRFDDVKMHGVMLWMEFEKAWLVRRMDEKVEEEEVLRNREDEAIRNTYDLIVREEESAVESKRRLAILQTQKDLATQQEQGLRTDEQLQTEHLLKKIKLQRETLRKEMQAEQQLMKEEQQEQEHREEQQQKEHEQRVVQDLQVHQLRMKQPLLAQQTAGVCNDPPAPLSREERGGGGGAGGGGVGGGDENRDTPTVDCIEFLSVLGPDGVNATITLRSGRCGTPLWLAARAMNDGNESGLTMAALLIEKGANVNAPGKCADGCVTSPLLWAALSVKDGKEGGLALAKVLVERGANVNAFVRDGDGNESTPLWLAAWAVRDGKEGSLDLATLLVKKGADINVIVKSGAGNVEATPLWLAAWSVYNGKEGMLELAKLLVQNGANVKGSGKYDDCEGTLLRMAAQAVRDGRPDGMMLVRLLCSRGACLANGESNMQSFVDQAIGLSKQ